jgi:NAD dependent epimerase/dehydratase family enzyme
MADLDDPEFREELASASYYRERYDAMVLDREHDADDEAQYFCVRWEELSSGVQRPYRTTVAVVLDHVKELVVA